MNAQAQDPDQHRAKPHERLTGLALQSEALPQPAGYIAFGPVEKMWVEGSSRQGCKEGKCGIKFRLFYSMVCSQLLAEPLSAKYILDSYSVLRTPYKIQSIRTPFAR